MLTWRASCLVSGVAVIAAVGVGCDFAPREGDWIPGASEVLRSECGELLDDDEESSEALRLESGDDGAFTFASEDTRWTCALSERDFTCDSQTQAFDMGEDDEEAVLQRTAALSGSFATAVSGTLNSRDVWRCEGDDCGGLEGWLDMSFPCEAETRSTIRAGAPAGGEDEPSVGGGALAYARECEAELGPVPGFDCSDGVVVPITVDGLVVGEDQEASSCDAPSIAEGDCNVGTRVGRIGGTTSNGAPDDEVVWAYLCRKYDGIVQLIGHDTATGATCFFESEWEVADTVDSLSVQDGLVVGPVPGPDDPDYEAVWKAPEEVASQECWGCHLADPFVHTPYVDGARLPDDPSTPVIPQVATADAPYFLVGEAVRSGGEGDDSLRTLHIEGNGCVSCHRFSDSRSFSFDGGPTWDPNEHMPPSAPGSLAADFQALLDCADSGPANTPGCDWRTIPGEPSEGCALGGSPAASRGSLAIAAAVLLFLSGGRRRRVSSGSGRGPR